MNLDEREMLFDALDGTAAQMAEEFDAVLILTSRQIDGATETYTVGRGNWFARIGMAQKFLEDAMNNGWEKPETQNQ